MHVVLQVKCPLFLILARTGICQQISAEFESVKFSSSRVADRQKQTAGQTDGHDDANKRIFATFRYEFTRNTLTSTIRPVMLQLRMCCFEATQVHILYLCKILSSVSW
jgi:hypothetical protein